MVLNTVESAGKKLTIYEGTAQEVLDAAEAHSGILGFTHNGTNYAVMVWTQR